MNRLIQIKKANKGKKENKDLLNIEKMKKDAEKFKKKINEIKEKKNRRK